MGEVLGEYLVGMCELAPSIFDKKHFKEGLRLALHEIKVDAPENFLPSRRTVMRRIKQKSDKCRNETKADISAALIKNPETRFTIQFDDGLLKHGTKENMRAIIVSWINEDKGVQRRFIKVSPEADKSSDSLKKTIEDVVAEYGIPDDYILLSDAAAANMKLSSGTDRLHPTCGDHMNHNAFENGLKQNSKKDMDFRDFYDAIQKTLEKGSRKHINQKMLEQDGWHKLKGTVNTRWASLIDACESLLHNWDILEAHPDLKKSALFRKKNGKQVYQKSDMNEFVAMISPFRKSIKMLEGYKQSSGHLMAMELQNLLVFYVNYNAVVENPQMLRNLAQEFVIQIEHYFDGLQTANGKQQKMKRIDETRVIQTALYIPSNMLEFFNCDNIKDEAKRPSIKLRYERLNKEFDAAMTKHDDSPSNESCNSSGSSLFRQSFGKSSLETQLFLFSDLTQKYQSSPEHEWPSALTQFHTNLNNGLDANTIFWLSQYAKDTFPLLRKIVMPLLPVSASTSMIEGTFSHCNQIRRPHRSKLLPENLDNFLVIHYSRVLTDH